MSAGNAFNGDEIDVSGNGGEEFYAVDLKKVSTESESTVCAEDIGWQVPNLIGGDMFGGCTHGFTVEGMDVRAIYGHRPFGVFNGDGTVLKAIFTYHREEIGVGGTTHEGIEATGKVGLFDLPWCIQLFVGGDGIDESVCRGRCAGRLSGMVVKTSIAFDKLHDVTVGLMNEDGGFEICVHCNATHLADGCKGEDIRDGILVVPNDSKTREIADHVRVLWAAVRVNAEALFVSAVSDVF